MKQVRVKRIPWGTVGSVLMTFLLAFQMAHEVLPALAGGFFLWVMLGLPVDAWFRTGRLSTAFTWALFPWFTGWVAGYALDHLTDPGSLWHVPAVAHLPGPLREFASFPGFALGLGLSAAIEWLENRTGKNPTVRPLQVFGVIFGVWLVSCVVFEKSGHLPSHWKKGEFLFGVGALCLAWLAVRVGRTVLHSNPTRQEIERLKATRSPPASPGS